MFLVISICPLAIYNSCAALFRAMNDSKTTMLIAAAMNLINLVGNAILIYGVKIGVAGAAIAAAFSRIAAAEGIRWHAVFLWFSRRPAGCVDCHDNRLGFPRNLL